MPVVVALAALFAVMLVFSAGEHAGATAWPYVTLAFFILMVLGFALWHHRKMAELREKHAEAVMGFWQVNKFRPWPKYCSQCGAEFSGWETLHMHADEETSPCARLLAHKLKLEQLEAQGLPMDGWQAEVLGSTEPPSTPEVPPLPADAARRPIGQ